MGLFSPSQKPSHGELPKVDQNLVAIGGDLSVPSLLKAYREGLFPWTVSPITWWSPDPRAIIEFNNFHLSKSLRRSLRKYEVTKDLCFHEVMEGCAERTERRPVTWITPEFRKAYGELRHAGYAHSLECWEEGRLAGGLYGVALGAYFVGESMFSRAADASKVILACLVPHLQRSGFTLFDVQMPTRVTVQLGATLLPRSEFLKRLRIAAQQKADFGPPGELAKPL
jgi:leucyl/phenylalanyl-tRNA--protein transferase